MQLILKASWSAVNQGHCLLCSWVQGKVRFIPSCWEEEHLDCILYLSPWSYKTDQQRWQQKNPQTVNFKKNLAQFKLMLFLITYGLFSIYMSPSSRTLSSFCYESFATLLNMVSRKKIKAFFLNWTQKSGSGVPFLRPCLSTGVTHGLVSPHIPLILPQLPHHLGQILSFKPQCKIPSVGTTFTALFLWSSLSSLPHGLCKRELKCKNLLSLHSPHGRARILTQESWTKKMEIVCEIHLCSSFKTLSFLMSK